MMDIYKIKAYYLVHIFRLHYTYLVLICCKPGEFHFLLSSHMVKIDFYDKISDAL